MLNKHLKNHHVITIIGTSKNAGKTTVLNQIISENSSPLGIISVGYEGEDIDLVSQTYKPKIFVKKGYIIATAEKLILESDVTLSILEKTSIPSPLGNIIIARAMSNGFVKIAGPSITTDLETVISLVDTFNPKMIIVDGALFKTSLSKNKYSDALILATSANLSPSIEEAVDKTLIFYNILNTPEAACYNKELINRALLSKYTLFNNEALFITTNSFEKLIDINKFNHLYINGALTDEIVNMIISNKSHNVDFEIIVNHSSQIVINDKLYNKLHNNLIRLSVMNNNNIILLTSNPTSILGYQFNNEEFMRRLKNKTQICVLNVKEVESC